MKIKYILLIKFKKAQSHRCGQIIDFYFESNGKPLYSKIWVWTKLSRQLSDIYFVTQIIKCI